MAINQDRAQDIDICGLGTMATSFGQGTGQIAKRLMAISLEPWPKILDIQGGAWGKPAGRRWPV